MALAVEGVFVFYTALGAVVFTVMSCVAGAALRSTKSQVTKLFRQQPWTHFIGFALDTVVVAPLICSLLSPPQAVVVMTAAATEAPVE